MRAWPVNIRKGKEKQHQASYELTSNILKFVHSFKSKMRICTTCKACYEDQETACCNKAHKQLISARAGGRLIAGKYRLDELLGHGGTGAVYRCTHLELNYSQAIKLLRPDFAYADPHGALRLRREALTACNFDHVNVVRMHDFGTNHVMSHENGQDSWHDELFIVMEFVQGQTLKDYLVDRGRLSYAEAIEIASQIAAGLAEVHGHGVVHRDLKPANIMLTHDRSGTLVIKILDFGAVKLINQPTTLPDLDLTGQMFIGSPQYASPESCRLRAVDGRSDIYSAGLILYEMIAGHSPYNASDFLGWLSQQAYGVPQSLQGIAPLLNDLIMGALSKSPDDRPQSATELFAALQVLRKSEGFLTDQFRNKNKQQDEDELTVVAANGAPVGISAITAIKQQNNQTRAVLVHTVIGVIILIVSVMTSLFLTVNFVRTSLSEGPQDALKSPILHQVPMGAMNRKL